jgi:hypothetical protein
MKKRVNEIMKFGDIKISESFAKSKPSLDKLIKCDAELRFNANLDRDIIVNENNVLIDGYVLYKVLSCYLSNDYEVKVVKMVKEEPDESYRDEMTMYIYGKHLGNLDGKEFIWRYPNQEGLAFVLPVVGEIISANTSKGISSIKITKISLTDICPVPEGQYVYTIVPKRKRHPEKQLYNLFSNYKV